MDGKRKFIFCVLIVLACVTLLLIPLILAGLEQAQQTLSWLLAMELITPSLIVAVVLIISGARKAHVA